jgi:hypothetical protein
MSNENEQAKALKGNRSFQTFPSAMQEWILASPNATTDFAVFFDKGGTIRPRDDVGLPSYVAREPPVIRRRRPFQGWAYKVNP